MFARQDKAGVHADAPNHVLGSVRVLYAFVEDSASAQVLLHSVCLGNARQFTKEQYARGSAASRHDRRYQWLCAASLRALTFPEMFVGYCYRCVRFAEN